MKKMFCLCRSALIASLTLWALGGSCHAESVAKSEAGTYISKSFPYIQTSPIDGKDIPTYCRDANGTSNFFYLKNDQVHVNFSAISSKNNEPGSMRPGTPMDVMPTVSGYVDDLDWSQMIMVNTEDLTMSSALSTLKRWDWGTANRHITLPGTSVVNNEVLISRGYWEGNDSIEVIATYSLVLDQPILRIDVEIINRTTSPFQGAFCYMMDPDLGNQYAYLPGKGWGKSNSLDAVTEGWNSNFLYLGTDALTGATVINQAPAHGIAWNNDVTPYAVLYPGYIGGVWFSVNVGIADCQKLRLYHIATLPSRTGTAYNDMAALAAVVESDSYIRPQTPTITGRLIEKESGHPIAGASIICKDTYANIVSTAETAADGSYTMLLPMEVYTMTASRLGYLPESRSLEVTASSGLQEDIIMEKITTTYASYGEKLLGILSEGEPHENITLQNSCVAMTVADKFVDSQLKTTKGKPINFARIDRADAFDWMNMPVVTNEKVMGEAAWSNFCVTFDTVYVEEVSPQISRVVAEGTCDTIPLSVKTVYEIRPNEAWVKVSSSFYNTTKSEQVVWLSDIIDLDETGEKSFYPTVDGVVVDHNNNATVEIFPTQPWMGQYGTATDQVFGIVYSDDFAQSMQLYGCQRWMMARKQVSIPASGEYTMTRKVVAITASSEESREQAFLNFYNRTFRENLHIDATFSISTKRAQIGDTINVRYTITNTSESESRNGVNALLTLPSNLSTDSPDVIIDIPAGLSQTILWPVVVREGAGNQLIRAAVSYGGEYIDQSNSKIFAVGSGWYAADNHSHSVHSDGSGTIAQNLTSARNKGLSFLSCTDHNKVSQISDIATFNAANNDMIGILGNEITTNGHGHVVGLFTDAVIPYSNINTLEKAQAMIDSIQRSNNRRGMAFIAHPYYPGLQWKWEGVKGMKGIEVWNGFYKPKHNVNAQAFAQWDRKIMADGQAYLGIANSDAHNSGKISDPRICAYIADYTIEAYYDAIKRGHFYGTDGPDIRLNIGNKMMGDTLMIRPDQPSAVTLSIIAMHSMGIDSIRLIHNGYREQLLAFAGEKRVDREVTTYLLPGDYVRIEADGKDATFAFSNPIFVRALEASTPFTITVQGATTDKERAFVGDTVTLTPNIPAEGYLFDGWDILSGGITIDKNHQFIMGWENVSVEAKWRMNTAITENHSNKLLIYPNPVDDRLLIHNTEATNFRIIMTDGSILLQGKLIQNSIDASSLPAGLYYLNIESQNLPFVKR